MAGEVATRVQCSGTAVTKGRRCTRKAPPGEVRCHHHATASAALVPYGSSRRTPAHAVTASTAAFNMEGVGWQTWRFGDRAWQREAWRLYDITGPLRFVAGWQANSVSRCRLYVAEVTGSGEAGEEVVDEDIAGLAAVPLGQGPAKDEALRLAALGLFVPGETYMVVEADAGPDGEDRWMVVTGRQIHRQGDQITVRRSLLQGGGDMIYRPGVDLIIRCWTPHPNDVDEPDSPTRSALPDLRELEAIKKREFAELDSRLAGAGVLLLPEGIDFPRGPDDLPGTAGFSALLQRTMGMSLRDRSSAAAMVPIVAQVTADAIDKIKHLTFWSELSEALLPMKESAIKSLAQSLDVPAEILTGVADVNHWCTVPGVEIMTLAGWKTHDQLTVGEQVLTLNHETGLSEWQPLQAVNTWDVTDYPMVAIKGRGHSSLTTLTHRWPTLHGTPKYRKRQWDTSGEMMARAKAAGENKQRWDYIPRAAPTADLPTEQKYSDALVELVAWYFTEGAHGVRPGRRTPKVVIHQSIKVNPENCARIRRALTELFGPESASLDKGGRYATAESVARRAEAKRLRAEYPRMSANEIGRRLGVSGVMAGKYLETDAKVRDSVPRWRSVLRRGGAMVHFVLNATAAEAILEHAPGRVVSLDFVRALTRSQLELFIDAAIRGDGHYFGATAYFSQKDPQMCDALELAAILSGRSVTRGRLVGIGRSATGPRVKTLEGLTIGGHTTMYAPRGRSFSVEKYTGTIWCPTTENRTWLARRNGTVYYTGNSAWQMSDDAIRTQIVPVLSRIADALTTGYLQGALEVMGLDPRGYMYAFDTSPLTVKPNRSADGLAYYQAGIISEAAAADAGAFGEEQLPDDAERLRRLAERLLAAAPTLAEKFPILLELVGIDAPPPVAIEGPPADDEGGEPEGEPAEPDGEEEAPPATEPDAENDTGPNASTAAVVAVCSLAMVRAMSLAGGRLVPHTKRDAYGDTPRHQLHTRIGPVDRGQADHVLRGAWDDLTHAAAELEVDARALGLQLHEFAADLLTRGAPYDPATLRGTITAAVALGHLAPPVGVAA